MTRMLMLCALLGAVAAVNAAPPSPPPHSPTPSAAGDHADDPAHALYREGYELVLRERWTEARLKFEELLRTHPRSAYRDDALYWSAYALSHADRKAALEAYRRLIREVPSSTYYDDAVADMARLGSELQVGVPPGVRVFTWSTGSTTRTTAPAAPAAVREFERELRKQSRVLGRLRAYPLLGVRVPRSPAGADAPDPRTTVRIEALYALGEGKEDRQSFEMLRGLAQNMDEPRVLREAALDVLLEYTTFDVLPVLTEVARRDTNAELQAYAIDYIGRTADKERSVILLADIFRTLPPRRREPSATLLFTVAEVGNDRAVEFLKDVALTHGDYQLRHDAVYYLGNIGGDRARAALREILGEP